MDSATRFQKTMAYDRPDRVPIFEEGIRDSVLESWQSQGMPSGLPLAQLFPTDGRQDLAPELDPRPRPTQWPQQMSDLAGVAKRWDATDPGRLPVDWLDVVQAGSACGDTIMLRVHRGLYQTLGVADWGRFAEINYLLADNPGFVSAFLEMQADFAARLVERIVTQVEVDAAVFSEPISDNGGPLISPRMFAQFGAISYGPLLEVLRQHHVETIIFRSYANANVLVPLVLEWGFNCLWACEVNLNAMDYGKLRREYGRELRLIGGIDVDVLRQDQDTIRREVMEKIPPLLADGGFIPLADGRIRDYVPYNNYVFYRHLLAQVIQGV